MIACLLTLSMSCVGQALVPTSDYWFLMLLRCFQAVGSASTYAVGMFLVVELHWLGELIMCTVTTRCWTQTRILPSADPE